MALTATVTRMDINAHSRRSQNEEHEDSRGSRVEDRKSRIEDGVISSILDSRSSIFLLQSSILDPQSPIFLLWLLTGPQPVNILSAPRRRVLIPNSLIDSWL